MNKYQYTPSNDKPQKIVIFIDYLRDRMKLTIMGEIIEGTSTEGDTITQVIKDLCLHTRYQYDEQTRLGYIQHKYTTPVKSDDIEKAIEYAEIICDIPVGNITAVKEVK